MNNIEERYKKLLLGNVCKFDAYEINEILEAMTRPRVFKRDIEFGMVDETLNINTLMVQGNREHGEGANTINASYVCKVDDCTVKYYSEQFKSE